MSLREKVCLDAKWLGVILDKDANDKSGTRITKDESRVSAWVIPTNEELTIASHTLRLLETLGEMH